MMQRSRTIAGNWKMYKTAEEAEAFIQELAPLVSAAEVNIFLAVPFTALESSMRAAKGTNIRIGAQNMHEALEGPFTGEISARMLKALGVHFVILGHSERRRLFHETNATIHKKIKRALEEGLLPILCVGESEEERAKGLTQEVLTLQLRECLQDVSFESLIIAYEPVWAIGTGKMATPEMAQEAHLTIRTWAARHFGAGKAEQITLLYGGSVKPETIRDLLTQKDIDGALVGGASLSVQSFIKIIDYQRQI